MKTDTASAPPGLSPAVRLYAEQVKLLYANLPLGVAAGLLNALILAFVQRSVIAPAVLTTWLGAIVVLSASRFAQAYAYRRAAPALHEVGRWGFWYTVGAGLSGAIWGSAGVFLFPADLAHQTFVIFVLAGMTAGGVVVFSAHIWTAYVFFMPTLLPLTVRLFVEGHDTHLAMGAMSTLFFLLMVVTARRMYDTTLTSLKLRFENTDLVAYLEKEKEATENLNRELVKEINARARIEEGLRESEGRVRAVVDNVLDGIITVNEDGTLESMNPAAERLFGYARDEAIGRHFKMLMPEAEREEYNDYLGSHLNVGHGKMIGFGLEVTGQRRDGTVFPMELGVSRMQIGRRQLFIGMVRDITQRKEVEHMKNQFIAAVSHELRTPLTSMQGSLSLLAEGVGGDLPERGQSLLTIARNNVERLVRLVNDILDVNDIQSGRIRLHLRPVDLTALVERAVEANRAQAAERGVRLTLRNGLGAARVQADGERLLRVLQHLLSNAVKFSPARGAVEIEVRRVDAVIRVSVTDRGPGIPEEFRERIFQAFSKAPSDSAPSQDGAGLGLGLARAVVELHGGRIGYASEPGAGTHFYFELPQWQDKAVPVSAGR